MRGVRLVVALLEVKLPADVVGMDGDEFGELRPDGGNAESGRGVFGLEIEGVRRGRDLKKRSGGKLLAEIVDLAGDGAEFKVATFGVEVADGCIVGLIVDEEDPAPGQMRVGLEQTLGEAFEILPLFFDDEDEFLVQLERGQSLG